MLTVILKITTSLDQLAEDCNRLLGEGANPEAEKVEDFFSRNNTQPSNGYIRAKITPEMADKLQYMLDQGITSEHGEVVRIEWHGQNKVVTGKDEWGNDVIEHQLFKTGTEDVLDADDNPTGETRPVYLASIV